MTNVGSYRFIFRGSVENSCILSTSLITVDPNDCNALISRGFEPVNAPPPIIIIIVSVLGGCDLSRAIRSALENLQIQMPC